MSRSPFSDMHLMLAIRSRCQDERRRDRADCLMAYVSVMVCFLASYRRASISAYAWRSKLAYSDGCPAISLSLRCRSPRLADFWATAYYKMSPTICSASTLAIRRGLRHWLLLGWRRGDASMLATTAR